MKRPTHAEVLAMSDSEWRTYSTAERQRIDRIYRWAYVWLGIAAVSGFVTSLLVVIA